MDIQHVTNWFLMSNALDIQSNPQLADPLHPAKLQQLLYQAQGYYLATYEARLIDEDVVTSPYGPSFASINNKYPDPLINTRPNDDMYQDYERLENLEDVNQILNLVYDTFGSESAVNLINYSINQDPWLNYVEAKNLTNEAKQNGLVIPDGVIYKYFKEITQ